ncbi:MAG: hypothetical protein MUC63_08495 [Planctomycetes bacterium]|jgi:hypothetical protein|nr:hypothetical protein [Planctomycetota bacterium]
MPEEAVPPNVPETAPPGTTSRADLCLLAPASLLFAFLLPPLGLLLGVAARLKITRSRDRLRGKGLANLGVVASLLFSLVLAIALPGLLRSRISSGETTGPGSPLKALCAGEDQFRNQALVDQDLNGAGEYGFLSELAGTAPCRGAEAPLSGTPFVPAEFGNIDAKGVGSKAGWCFKVYLPGGPDSALEEARDARLAKNPAASPLQQACFVAYAWPMKTGRTGTLLGVIDPRGQVFVMPCPAEFSGPANPPPWNFAFQDSNGDGKRNWDDEIGGSGWKPYG